MTVKVGRLILSHEEEDAYRAALPKSSGPARWIQAFCFDKMTGKDTRLTRTVPSMLIVALAGLALIDVSGDPGFGSRAEEAAMQATSTLLIDDFSGEQGTSVTGTEWRLFTDRVMGGVSDATSSLETIEGRRCLRLQGRVSLENNGGFIQVALPLDQGGRPFDASEFKGVRAWVRGNGETYHIHLRTAQTGLPWQYFSAALGSTAGWRPVDLPFDGFKPENLQAKLDTRGLERIAVVAIGKEFEADVAVSRLEFYR